ncbi:MAG: glycogen phosphorylase, partial [Oribacterium sp.]|nr:glycogen phosphorylase [Oribacterium sp.]
MEKFDKELLKKEIKSSARKLYRRSLEDLNTKEAFFAVSYAVQNTIIDDWMATQKVTEKKDAKRVYYLSMEFLMGRALGNNIINLSCRD